MKHRANLLVLGATGHLGQAVVREAAARGYRITAATRQPGPPSLTSLNVRVAHGDATQPGQLMAWTAGHDFVVDAAAPYPLSLFVLSDARQPDPVASAFNRTRALLDAVARYRARLVFVSSFTTLPRPGNGLATLESRWRRTVYPYFRVKQLMEDMVMEAAQRGLPAVVVNPSALLGPFEHRSADSSFAGMVLSQRLPLVMRQLINVIDVRDVAIAISAALDAGRNAERITLAGHNIALDELARRIAALGGVPAPAFVVDPRVTAIGAFWLATMCAMSGVAAPPALNAVPLMADAWPMEQSREQRALGLRIRPLEETLRDTVHWQLEHGAEMRR